MCVYFERARWASIFEAAHTFMNDANRDRCEMFRPDGHTDWTVFLSLTGPSHAN